MYTPTENISSERLSDCYGEDLLRPAEPGDGEHEILLGADSPPGEH